MIRMASESKGRGPRRLVEFGAVLACAGAMAVGGNALASSNGPNGHSNGHANGHAYGHTTGPSGPALQHRCKKDFKGNRKHRKCRHRHRGKGSQTAPGQQK
jgi:hypothetical protein